MSSLSPHAKKILDGYGPCQRIALAGTLEVRPVGSSRFLAGIVGGAHKVAVMSQQREMVCGPGRARAVVRQSAMRGGRDAAVEARNARHETLAAVGHARQGHGDGPPCRGS